MKVERAKVERYCIKLNKYRQNPLFSWKKTLTLRRVIYITLHYLVVNSICKITLPITNYLQTEYQNKISNINKLNTILYKNTNNQQFLYNPNELKNYLTCKIIKT